MKDIKKAFRILTKEEVNEILSLYDRDIHLDFLKENFATDENGVSKFETSDIFITNYNDFLRSIGYSVVEEKIKKLPLRTTVGRMIFNKFMNDNSNQYFYRSCGYINYPLNKDNLNKMESLMANALLIDKITPEDYADFIDRRNWIAYNVVSFISPSFTSSLLIPRKEVLAKKKELFKKYDKQLKEDPIVTSSMIEKQLIEYAKELLKDDPSMSIFDSGSRGSFGNHYKNMSIMRGVMVDGKGEVHFSKNGLVEGIDKENFEGYANIAVNGSYGRAIETKIGGYLGKQLTSAFQQVILDEKDTDCKTKEYLEVTITPEDVKSNFYQLRYILVGTELVLLSSENISKYLGKKVKMRSPMFCHSDKLCNKCAGELYYKLGVKNVGLLFSRMAGAILNISMSKFHNTTISTKKINFEEFIKKI